MYIDYDLLAWWIEHILRLIGLSVALVLYLIFVMTPVMIYDFWFMTYDVRPLGGRFGNGH